MREREIHTIRGEASTDHPLGEGLDELLGPSMTFEVILIKIKYLHIHNISIHIIFYQNRFINECVRKNFLKFSEGQM